MTSQVEIMDIFPTFVLLFLSHLPSLRGITPPFFPCDNNEAATEVICTHRPISDIPLFTSINVSLLDLSHTKVRDVKQHKFSGIPNLLTLKMRWNCAPKTLRTRETLSCHVNIHKNALQSLHNLTYLYLEGNSLTTLPWLPESIRLLHLESNSIFNIVTPFGTPQLEQLLLAKNCYYENPCHQSFHIHENVYKELSHLKNLSLGYNNLTSIPQGLPASLIALDLGQNTITEIPERAFAQLPKLKYLKLGENCQRCGYTSLPCSPCPNNASLQLHPNSFYANSSSIRSLKLGGNSLHNIPEGLFLHLTHLKWLDLSDNYLAYTIRNGTFFTELKQVIWINLRYNFTPLKTFHELILSPDLGMLSNLQTLLLSGNFFSTVPEKSLIILSRLKKLKMLEMHMNFIFYYNLSTLGMLPSLTRLDLSQNILSYLPCHVSSGYSLQQCPKKTFKYFSDLPMMPASAHMDQTVAENDTCASPNNVIFEMWHFNQKFCKNNLTIDLSQNNVIFLHEDVFVGMENVACLNLSYNYASQALKGRVFSHLKSLVYLDMSYNRIDLYHRDAFSELNETLKVLDLSHNEYHFRMKGMGHRLAFIDSLTNLEILNLANNGIGRQIFPRLSSNSVTYLYFSGNCLNIMLSKGQASFYFFQGLRKLIYLDIAHNRLPSIEQQFLCNLPVSLQAISISNNDLYYFPWPNLTCVGNLTHLNLSGNRLSFLTDSIMEFPPNFSLLDLSSNKITYLPDQFFSQAKALQCLYLNNNYLKVLTLQSLPPLLKNGTSHQLLTLHDNHLSCDCHNFQLEEFLRTSNTRIPYLTTAVHCEFPESLQGQSVLTVDKRSCQEIYGGLAFLLCTFFICAFISLPLLRHLFGWDVWYCLQILWARCKGYLHSSATCSPKHYDAFVVFDTNNQAVRDWVYNELVFRLESSGHRRFSLCLEERDWIPGLSCIENLHHAVYSSEKTVFVFSNGTGNGVGEATANGVIRQTFFMVQQRLLDDKVDVAVLVLLDKMFPKLKYLQLRTRLCRKSVMSWPRNPKAQPLFWNQMRTALSSDNLKFYDNNISESFK